jgi:tetratricopeptide (TPR) repeat protein
MAYFCRYHPLEHAAWFCPSCKIMFCEQCAPEDPEDPPNTPRECLLCKSHLSNLGRAHTATPFWQQLMGFLQAPLALLPLGVMLPGLILPFLIPGFFGQALLGVVYLAALLKYGMGALELRADGETGPFSVQQLTEIDNNKLCVGLLWRLGAVAIGIAWVMERQPFFGGVLAVLLVLLLPAMLIAAAANRDASTLTNMRALLAVVLGMEVMYLPLALLLLALIIALQSFVGVFAPVLPDQLGAGLRFLGLGYFLLVALDCCGYVLFQYQVQLEYAPRNSRGRRSKVRPDLARIRLDLLMKDGRFPKAVELLRHELTRKGVSVATHERYHKLIWSLHDEEALNKHAGPFFSLLLKNGRDVQALALFRTYLGRNKDFRPESPDVRLDLAKAFISMNEYKMAMHVLNGLHKDAPHFVGLPEAYLLAAHILADKLDMPQKALALLVYLDGRFKTHESYPEIRAFKDKLVAATRAAGGPA